LWARFDSGWQCARVSQAQGPTRMLQVLFGLLQAIAAAAAHFQGLR
jgi:hypothetical protein